MSGAIWFAKLEKLLAAMPEGYEISVCTSHAACCDINLHRTGDVQRLENDNSDRARSDFSSIALCSFLAESVIANSESI